MPSLITNTGLKQNRLSFLTPIRFHAAVPSALYGLQDARRIIPYPKRWILENVPAYLSPFATSTVYIEGFLKEENCFVGRREARDPSSFWITMLKVISFATFALPFIAFMALLYVRFDFLYMEKTITERSFKIFKTWLVRFRARKLKRTNKLQMAAHNAFFERFIRNQQKGGPIYLKDLSGQVSSQEAWISFKNANNFPLTKIIQIKDITGTQLLASARLVLSETPSTARLDNFYSNREHTWSQSFKESYTPIQILARHILGAGVRYLASLSSDDTQKLTIQGDLASLLTQDGPDRVLEERFICERQTPTDPFSDALVVEAPLLAQAHLPLTPLHTLKEASQSLTLGAREQIYLPKHPARLMVDTSDRRTEQTL